MNSDDKGNHKHDNNDNTQNNDTDNDKILL